LAALIACHCFYCFNAPTFATDITLVRDGRSDYTIHIAPNSAPAVKRGAIELQRFIEQISGAKLPVN
jgi:hypothetical protein